MHIKLNHIEIYHSSASLEYTIKVTYFLSYSPRLMLLEEVLSVPLMKTFVFFVSWQFMLIHVQGEQNTPLHGPLHAKWNGINWRLHWEVVANGVAPRVFSAESAIQKSTEKLSQVLDTRKNNMYVCIYP
jgi:hypothetical protein